MVIKAVISLDDAFWCSFSIGQRKMYKVPETQCHNYVHKAAMNSTCTVSLKENILIIVIVHVSLDLL